MSESPRDARGYESQAERYAHAPGSFNAVVDAFEIPGEPEASILIRRVCRVRTVWPEQLFGYERAEQFGATHRKFAPLSTGRCGEPSRKGYIVLARRLIWRGLYHCTDLSIENIAEMFGYSTGAVRPWATSWRPFEKAEGAVWWHFWGPSLADDVGVPFERYDPVSEAEAVTSGVAG